MAEDIECMCQIMSTTGKRLDTDKAKVRKVVSILLLLLGQKFLFQLNLSDGELFIKIVELLNRLK